MPDASESPEELTRRVALQGNLGLRDVRQAYELLSDAVSAHRVVELDVREVSGIDISIIQLIAAARRSAQQRGGALTLVSKPNSVFTSILLKAGLLGADGAGRTIDEEFWAGKLPAGGVAS
jgi:ABC-type transporter Mla MlaB component